MHLNFRIICFLLREQHGCTKYPCYHCMCYIQVTIYSEIGQNLLVSYKMLTCITNIKMHFFLYGYFDTFPSNHNAVSDDQRQEFHQDFTILKKQYFQFTVKN